jgi:hypothetical protein
MYFLLMECQSIRKGGGKLYNGKPCLWLKYFGSKFRIWNLPLSGRFERPHTLSLVILGVDFRLLGKAGTTTTKKFTKDKSNNTDQSL